jgi:hypothetical protein
LSNPIALSFDVDYWDYLNDGPIDEMELMFQQFHSLFVQIPEIKCTWFIRIDDQMEALFGSNDHVFQIHAEKLDLLKEIGHEIGFHFHSYRLTEDKWRANTDASSIFSEFREAVAKAGKHDLRGCRMGWAYQTNDIMNLLAEEGFLYDSSALPRPSYPWENSMRNWDNCPYDPYFPSRTDYRIPSSDALPILEIPMSIAPLHAENDTLEMLRYINPAYEESVFKKALSACLSSIPVLVMHPYEVFPNSGSHKLLSFSFNTFENNLRHLVESGYHGITLSQLAEDRKTKSL